MDFWLIFDRFMVDFFGVFWWILSRFEVNFWWGFGGFWGEIFG